MVSGFYNQMVYYGTYVFKWSDTFTNRVVVFGELLGGLLQDASGSLVFLLSRRVDDAYAILASVALRVVNDLVRLVCHGPVKNAGFTVEIG